MKNDCSTNFMYYKHFLLIELTREFKKNEIKTFKYIFLLNIKYKE